MNVSQKNQQDIVPIGFIYILLIISFDHVFFQILPTWIGKLPRYLIIFFLIVQSFRAFRITGIPELFVVSTAIFIVFLRLPPVTLSNISTIPSEDYNSSFFKITTNLLVISLIIPWNWLSYQKIRSKILKVMLVTSTILVYPLIVIGQFIDLWSGTLYIFAIIFLLSWSLIAAVQVKPFYHSDWNKRGKVLLILTPLSLLVPLILLLAVPIPFTFSLPHLGVNTWLILIWYTVASYPHAFFLTQAQTTRAASSFYDIKATHETIECMIYDNVDHYLRNIPEKTVMEVDNDKLTLMWIGLQRRHSIV